MSEQTDSLEVLLQHYGWLELLTPRAGVDANSKNKAELVVQPHQEEEKEGNCKRAA